MTPIRERTSTDEQASLHEWSHPSSTGLVDRIRQLILVPKGMSFVNSRVPSWHPSTCINIFPRSMKAIILPNLVHFYSGFNTLWALLLYEQVRRTERHACLTGDNRRWSDELLYGHRSQERGRPKAVRHRNIAGDKQFTDDDAVLRGDGSYDLHLLSIAFRNSCFSFQWRRSSSGFLSSEIDAPWIIYITC